MNDTPEMLIGIDIGKRANYAAIANNKQSVQEAEAMKVNCYGVKPVALK